MPPFTATTKGIKSYGLFKPIYHSICKYLGKEKDKTRLSLFLFLWLPFFPLGERESLREKKVRRGR